MNFSCEKLYCRVLLWTYENLLQNNPWHLIFLQIENSYFKNFYCPTDIKALHILYSNAYKEFLLHHVPGLSDEMRADFHVMKDLATHTRVGPQDRNDTLQKFMNDMRRWFFEIYIRMYLGICVCVYSYICIYVCVGIYVCIGIYVCV